MIVKPSTKAADLAFLEEIIADEEFATLPAATQDRLRRHRRGLWGERDTAHMLDRHFHAKTNTAVVHDLRLPDGMGGYAQFDHLLLNRIGELATIIEVKNYAGTLSKNEHNEWIVWYKGQRTPKDIPNPVAQARRQAEVLRSWLREHGLAKAFPNVNVFVSVPPECKIDRSKIGSDVPIVKSDNLFAAWEQSFDVSGLDLLLGTHLSALQLQQVAKRIAKAHVPPPDIYDELKLRPADDDVSLNDDVLEDAEQPQASALSDVLAEDVARSTRASDVHASADEGAVVEEGTLAGSENTVQRNRNTGTPYQLCAGIFERVLRDGRIGFSADARDEAARDRLKSACRGRAQWISRYQNWVCDDDRALEIRNLLAEGSGLGATVRSASELASGELPADRTVDPAPTKKAGPAAEICEGITTRELPDGRHAFRARKSDQAAKDALSAACKGVGQWNPLYQNWIVPADRAPAIRAAIEAALSDHAGTDNTSAPVTRGDGAKNREVIV
ncbi:nuclease-related domain-containing protein [Sphingomonas sp. ABOLG]|jgi:hypothetical protein|uniref:nuclease-related domain-containing protein n=1 Tax=Sphingomonas sp. ABOLG TaxID=1985880 RepID=UPI0013DE6FCF|nr:nuclease-related domain-containing protein [Sphingomonas sp. ABOLG]